MLPLTLLNSAQGKPVLAELKNGETYNGHLFNSDHFMNINLHEVICTSPDGTRFWKMPECYIKGSTIKYLRIPDEVIEQVLEEKQQRKMMRQDSSRGGRNSRDHHSGSRPYQSRDRRGFSGGSNPSSHHQERS